MLKIKIVLLSLFICVSVISKPITIQGKAVNNDNGKVFIYAYEGQDLILFDSVITKKGAFVFKNKEIPRGLYKIGVNATDVLDIILGNENLSIYFDKNNFLQSFKVSNSSENDGLAKFNKANMDFGQKIQVLESKAQGIFQYKYSDPQKFEMEIGKLQKTADSLSKILYSEYEVFAKDESLFISKYAKSLSLKDTIQKRNIFKATELSDLELCRSNAFAVKTQMYFQRYTKPEIPEYQASADELMNNLAAGTKGKELIYKSMISIFSNANLDYYGTIVSRFKSEYINDQKVQSYIKKLPKKDLTIGDEVPDLVFKDTSNKTLALSSLKGKVVLIDFWASWCGPCRMENPNVVKVYKKYKDRGFTVYGVSLDQSKDKWISAIKNDGLTWNHVSDLKGWSSDAAKLYGVKSIPQTYLIDAEGKIIAKNLRGEMLEQKLMEIFKE